ncbi:hypothetical protein QCA50_007992 [Cerrena zonata]|uniref:Uncharacterized protein n=1 Tax=Cerrena zonata TaxID=2478898 RepID=A0AAW0G9Y8_9APHY
MGCSAVDEDAMGCGAGDVSLGSLDAGQLDGVLVLIQGGGGNQSLSSRGIQSFQDSYATSCSVVSVKIDKSTVELEVSVGLEVSSWWWYVLSGV